ncbi:DUF169 domain-containing protein [Chloroflexota bacterium]
MGKWAELSNEIERYVRPATYILGFSRLEKVEDAEKMKGVRGAGRHCTFCQLVTLARKAGQTISATADDMTLWCSQLLGLWEEAPEEVDFKRRVGYFYEDLGDAKKARQSIVTIPFDGKEAIIIGPLAKERFDPEVLLIYGSSAQMSVLMCAMQVKDYERLQFFYIGESACSDALCQSYVSGKPALTVPCIGERFYGGVDENELVFAVPSALAEKLVSGLSWLHEKGLRYPIVPMGPLVDPTEQTRRLRPGAKGFKSDL